MSREDFLQLLKGTSYTLLVVDKGKIVQKGKHDELMKQEGIYKNFITGRKQAVSWKLA